MSPHRVRPVRFWDMMLYDCTRPTEFISGLSAFALGLVFLAPSFAPPSVATAYWLWRYIGPTPMGWGLMTGGLLQMAAAGTKWVALRKYAAIAGAMSAAWILMVYLQTTGAAWWPGLYLGLLIFRETWVAFRIFHDKGVNGADRRLTRQYYGPWTDDGATHGVD